MDEEINTLFSDERFDEVVQTSNKLSLIRLKPKTLNQIGVARLKTGKYVAGVEAFKHAARLDDFYVANYLRALEKAKCINDLCADTLSGFSPVVKTKVCNWIIERHGKFDDHVLKNLIEKYMINERFLVLQRLLFEENLDSVSIMAKYLDLTIPENTSKVLAIFKSLGRVNFISKVTRFSKSFSLIERQLSLVDMGLEEKYHEFIELFNSDWETFIKCIVLQEYYLTSAAAVDKKGLFQKLLMSDDIDLSVKAAFQKFAGQGKHSKDTLKRLLDDEQDESVRRTIIYNLAEQGYYHSSLNEMNVGAMGRTFSDIIILNSIARFKYHLRDYEGSFKAIRASNDLHSDLSRSPPDYERLINSYGQLASFKGDVPCFSDYSPIFIVGAPRCGSTLLEAKLSSNSALTSLGESNLLSIGLSQLKLGKSYQEVSNYITSRLKKNSFGKIPVIKLLENIFYVPVILNLFPNAKIIYIARDHQDIAWSVYENFFTSTSMEYATSLQKIKRHLDAVEGANNLWASLNFQNYTAITYKDIATNLTATLTELSEFLSTAIKNKDVGEQVIYTASTSQVRSQVKFQTGRWRTLYNFFDKEFKEVWDTI